jgi:hypothetical protein
VFVNGLTTFVPDEYVYVNAPDGVIVKLLPVQITPEFTVIVGVVFTVIVTLLIGPVQPAADANTLYTPVISVVELAITGF